MASIERELEQAARRHRTQTERLTGQRDELIRQAARAGLSRRRIASIVELSFQRVDQIIRRGDQV